MRVFLTGGTGFVGRAILDELLAVNHLPVCLVRPGSYKKIADAKGEMEIFEADALDSDALTAGMKDCQAVIHLIGVVRPFYWKDVTFQKYHIEVTRNVIAAARKNGIRRFIFMSALGVEKDLDTKYMNTKREMEKMVLEENFNFTIFRPSVIFGEHDDFFNMLRDMIRNPLLPFVPVVGNGEYPLQPISLHNVAQAFVRSLQEPRALGKFYDLAGEEKITMNELLDLIGKSAGKEKIFKLHLPVWLVHFLAALFNQIPMFPITTDQIKMLLIGNTTKRWQTAFREFELKPVSLRHYLNCLKRQAGAV